ncbi:MAG: hypothetical protein EBT09_10385, partial [Actinobacteria bacterium]|nr:hypothetical protein [Actinomycetota bacterium]
MESHSSQTAELTLVDAYGDAPESVTVSVEEPFDVLEPEAVGYTFDGWYDAAVGGNHITDFTSINSAGIDRTLYAHWTIKTSVITFDADNGTATTTQNWTFAALFTPPTEPTKAGYAFDGWFDENDV